MNNLALLGYNQLWLAILADVGTMLVVTLNGVSVLKKKPKQKSSSAGESLDSLKLPLHSAGMLISPRNMMVGEGAILNQVLVDAVAKKSNQLAEGEVVHRIFLHELDAPCDGETVLQLMKKVDGVTEVTLDFKGRTYTVRGSKDIDMTALLDCADDMGFDTELLQEETGGRQPCGGAHHKVRLQTVDKTCEIETVRSLMERLPGVTQAELDHEHSTYMVHGSDTVDIKDLSSCFSMLHGASCACCASTSVEIEAMPCGRCHVVYCCKHHQRETQAASTEYPQACFDHDDHDHHNDH